MVTFLIHTCHIRFVVFVSVFQCLIAIFWNNFFALLSLTQSWNRTELVKYLVLFFEAKSSKEIFEILNIKLSFSSFIGHSKQSSNFFSRNLSTIVFDKPDQIFSSDKLSIFTNNFEDMFKIEIERTQQSLMKNYQSKIGENKYFVYCCTI